MSTLTDGHNSSSNAEFAALRNMHSGYIRNYVTEMSDDNINIVKESRSLSDLSPSPYSTYLVPTFAYSINVVEFSQTISGKDITFTPPSGYDLLRTSYNQFDLPDVRIVDSELGKYQICWSPDSAEHIRSHDKLRLGDNLLCELSSIANVMLSQFDIDYNHKKSIKRDFGNIKELTQWSTHLPHHTLLPDQKWYYSKSRGWEFPMNKVNSQNTLTHTTTLRLKINELLRMRMLVDGKWVNIKPDMKKIIAVNRKGDTVHSIEKYKMFGEMVNLTAVEKEIFHDSNREYAFENIAVSTSSFNKDAYNQSVKSKVVHAGGLVRAVYWGALNETAKSMNDLSNFTTDHINEKNGISLCRKTDVKHGKSDKIISINSKIFNGPHARTHFKSTSGKVGVHALAFCENINSDDLMAINTDRLKTKIINKIVKSNRIDSKDYNNNYTMYICCQTIKYIKFNDGGFKVFSVNVADDK